MSETQMIVYGLVVLMVAFGAGYSIGRMHGRLDEARDRLKKYRGEE